MKLLVTSSSRRSSRWANFRRRGATERVAGAAFDDLASAISRTAAKSPRRIDQLGHAASVFHGNDQLRTYCQPCFAPDRLASRPSGHSQFRRPIERRCVTLAGARRAISTYAVGKWHVGGGAEAVPTAQIRQSLPAIPRHSRDQWDAAKYQRLPTGERTLHATGQVLRHRRLAYAIEFIRQAQGNGNLGFCISLIRRRTFRFKRRHVWSDRW